MRLIDLEAESVVADIERVMLGHLVLVDDLAHPHTDGIRAAQVAMLIEHIHLDRLRRQPFADSLRAQGANPVDAIGLA